MKQMCVLVSLLLVESMGSLAYAQQVQDPATQEANPNATKPTASTEAPTTPAPKPVEEPPKPRTGFSVMADVGYAYRDLFGIPIQGAEVQVGLGGMKRIVGIYGGVSAMLGVTEHDLMVTHITAGCTVMFNLSERFHLSVAPRVSYFRVDRITEDNSMTNGGIGIAASAYYDVWKVDQSSIYVGLRLSAETIASAYYGITPGIGFRY